MAMRFGACVLSVVVGFSFVALGQKSRPAATDAKEAKARADAKKHFQKAKTLYRQARYREAIAELEAAYALNPQGVIHFNIAQSYEKLGDIANALKSYDRYLREVPDADDKATVQVAMKNLEKRLAEKGLQQLRVYSEPTGGVVLVDGERKGVTPFAAELPLGKHKVAVEVEGYQLKEREVELTADTSVALDFTLEKRTEAVPLVTVETPPPPKDEPPPPPKLAEAPSIDLTPPPGQPSPPPPEKGRLWTYVAAGVAGAALVGALVLGSSAQSASDELLAKPHDRATTTQLRDTARSSASTANVLFGVAGAAGVASAALFFVEGSF